MQPQRPDVRTLLQDTLAGDRQAFDELYKVLAGPFQEIARGLTRQDADRANLFQELWLHLLKKGDQAPRDSPEHCWYWVLRVARNCGLDCARQLAARRPRSLEVAEESGFVPAQRREESVLLSFWEDVENLLGQLDPNEQEVIKRRRQGLEFHQIAEALNWPLATAYGRYCRALSKLRDVLREKYPDEFEAPATTDDSSPIDGEPPTGPREPTHELP
jgi:RNA polymerase sigma factor (sigma-70 family)